ncbi:hypothetical protein PCC9214_02186 [Planktothrix tepida]|uniref:H repeat-associated protein N-terminal domain-containing protein n=2 Tax=Planktothrix TaxID=54304 RepID=A0A1J1LGQ5_9CYAN|nr:ISAs1 family transposase [Planktothrix pseudagardhii]CAD5925061.1 hypothetical protein PCC9214_00914 [Planktothrix tepida]CUR31202.1 conserved hypothetical protein [Planktothrix tepida PCC 9214]CAD5921948.1 hypothetical protein NO713_00721 [Planktothrix pseudagardhii]CAD5945099.1 hypothetical protein PCC9214_02186 [Planktothrix tepida]CAD5973877.1 hypothetical protein NO713_04019 [Planktothrix pseudagardhii]
METNLVEELKKIKDFRINEGRRHPLWLVLLIVIMGTMSGYLGYRALGDFVTRHKEALIQTLKVPKNRLPSYSTIRRVMMGIDFEEFLSVFNNWAIATMEPEGRRWYAVDGKTLRGSQKTLEENYTQFVQVVSVYSTTQGLIAGMAEWLSQSNSELIVVQNLIKTLGLEDAVFTLDALHCQKKPQKLLLRAKTTISSPSRRTKKSCMKC